MMVTVCRGNIGSNVKSQFNIGFTTQYRMLNVLNILEGFDDDDDEGGGEEEEEETVVVAASASSSSSDQMNPARDNFSNEGKAQASATISSG
jgi:hypothetical protein